MTTTTIACGPLTLTADFDSGNILKAEFVEPSHLPIPVPSLTASNAIGGQNNNNQSTAVAYYQLQNQDYEINVWTRPDCYGTAFENGNRTWFYFGIKGGKPNGIVKINILNLNKQSKLFMQGMAPVFRILPERPSWLRVPERIVLNENKSPENLCSISFRQRLPDNPQKSTLYIAFTYPFSYLEMCDLLTQMDTQFLNKHPSRFPFTGTKRRELWLPHNAENDIYYHRECVCYSLEGKRVDLLTISSMNGVSDQREERLGNLFPIKEEPRPFKFPGKKVVFLSARVHPGETPSSFVLNGFLKFIMEKTDPRAVILRRLFVFKLIPILNPDGVYKGHYRTDPRGVNLNRMYLNPSPVLHPSIYAARKLLIYYHSGVDAPDVELEDPTSAVENAVPISEEKAAIGKNLIGDSCGNVYPSKSESVEIPRRRMSEESCAMQVDDCSSSASGISSETGAGASMNKKEDKKPYTFVLSDANSLCAGCVLPFDEEAQSSCSSTPNVSVPQSRSDSFESVASVHHQCAFEACDEDSVFYENLKAVDAINANNSMEVDLNVNVLQTQPPTLLEENKSSGRPSASSRRKKKGSSAKGKTKSSAKSSGTEILKDNKGPSSSNLGSGVKKDQGLLSTILGGMKFPLPKDSKTGRLTRSQNKGSLGFKSNSRYYDSTSGLFLYVDMHGHTTKRGIFMYGNHFPDVDTQAECMLVPRLMAVNNPHFDFAACNFTERLMCVKDRRDGASREGSGRVACLKLTGLIRSYTLECNYNTGRIVNPVVSRPSGSGFIDPGEPSSYQPPKYTIELFEGLGKALAESLLDMTGHNPWSRLNMTEFKTLDGVKRSLISRLKLSPEFKTSSTTDVIFAKKPSVVYEAGPLLPTVSLAIPPKVSVKKPKSIKVLLPTQSGPLGPRRENQNSNPAVVVAKASGSHKTAKKLPRKQSPSELPTAGSSKSPEKSSTLSKSSLAKVMKKKSFPKFTTPKAKQGSGTKGKKKTTKSELLPK